MNMDESKSFIKGIQIGHYTDLKHGTGCTAIVAPEGATCAVDVRGGAPATRESDLLSPDRTVQKAHCVMLSGGSAYGLETCSGAMDILEKKNIGLNVGLGVVPIVPGACLFDLYCGSFQVRPNADTGKKAILDALEADQHNMVQGNVGAGIGCTVAKFGGMEHAMKGGLGLGMRCIDDLAVSAVVAVNACGDIINPYTNEILCASYSEVDGIDVLTTSAELLKQKQHNMPLDITNTTLGCVMTNARLTQAEAKRVAIMAHDGYANCIHPVHSPLDGDVIFVLATDKCQAPLELIGVLAQEAIQDAIVNAVMNAESLHGYKAYKDLKRSQQLLKTNRSVLICVRSDIFIS